VGEEGGWGEVRAARRSPQHRPETVATLFHRVVETHTLPTSVSLNTILRTIVEPLHSQGR